MLHHRLRARRGGGPITLHGVASSTTNTVTLPAGVLANDLVLVCSVSDSGDTLTPSGYTLGQMSTSSSPRYGWWYKVMGSTPDTTVTGLVAEGDSVNLAMVFRGVNTTTHLDVAAPTVATGASGMPNAPSITTATAGAVVVAIGYLDDDVVAASVTAPAGYTLVGGYQGGSADAGSTLMAAYKTLTTAGAEDPAAFGGSGSDDWIGATVALRRA